MLLAQGPQIAATFPRTTARLIRCCSHTVSRSSPLADTPCRCCSRSCGCTSGRSPVKEMGVRECVDACGVSHQHPASPEGEDCDAIWSASIHSVQAWWLKDGCQASCGKGLVNQVVESCVAGQVAGVPGAGEAVVAECVCHDSTAAAMRLVDTYAQPQCDAHTDRFIWEEAAKALYGDG